MKYKSIIALLLLGSLSACAGENGNGSGQENGVNKNEHEISECPLFNGTYTNRPGTRYLEMKSRLEPTELQLTDSGVLYKIDGKNQASSDNSAITYIGYCSNQEVRIEVYYQNKPALSLIYTSEGLSQFTLESIPKDPQFGEAERETWYLDI